MTDNPFLYILLIFIVLIIFLAYMPVKCKEDDSDFELAENVEDTDLSDECETKAVDTEIVEKKLYSAIMAAFGDALEREGKIITYSSAELNRFDEPIVSVITLLLPNDMLYLKFDYNLDSRQLVKNYSNRLVKLDTANQRADIYTERLHHDTLEDNITLTLALDGLLGCDMLVVSEV